MHARPLMTLFATLALAAATSIPLSALAADRYVAVDGTDLITYVEHGETVTVASSGAVAGIETQGQNAGQAMVGIVSTISDGVLDVIALHTEVSNIVPGATIAIDGGNTKGIHVRMAWPFGQFTLVGSSVDGSLTLDEADTQPGNVITGTLQGSFAGRPEAPEGE